MKISLHFRIEKNFNEGKIGVDCHFDEEFSSLGIKKVPINVLKELKIDIISFCETSIQQDFYVFLPIETAEISNYINYKKIVAHQILIYGYDDKEKFFYCSEFFGFSYAPYSSQKVSYKEMESSFYKLQSMQKNLLMTDEGAKWRNDIQLLHCITEYYDKFY